MARVIFESNLSDLALSLIKNGPVFVPAKANHHSAFSEYSFVELTKDTICAFDYPTTDTSPKNFLLPPKDTLFEFENGKRAPQKAKTQTIFGVSLKDLEGLSRLEEVFSKPIRDEQFSNRAEMTTLVCVDHFSPPANLHFDLYLQKSGNETYVGHAKTKRGQEILKSPYFKNQTLRIPNVARKKDALLSHPDLAKIIEKSRNHPVWEELSEICFGCGICSYVCPLCYCFETEDVIDITKGNSCGMRCRNWDSCMLASFTEKNAGKAHEELSARIYNWYFHKFVRMPREYKFSGCVDCNRCVIYCPAKINYRKTLTRLISDWEKNNEKL